MQALKRHIQVIHKKLNQIPNEDRKCRSRKRPQGIVKRPIESINAKESFLRLCLEGFQFRWLNVKEFDAAFPI